MRSVELTNSFEEALVSDQDYQRVMTRNWHVTPNGYVVANDHDEPRLLHRFVLVEELEENQEVDHKHGNLLDCTRENLRVATRSQNAANNFKPIGGTSKFKGVYWNNSKDKWQASIKVNGKVIYLGRFRIEEEAALAYDRAAEEHFGEFSRTNFREQSVGKPPNAFS